MPSIRHSVRIHHPHRGHVHIQRVHQSPMPTAGRQIVRAQILTRQRHGTLPTDQNRILYIHWTMLNIRRTVQEGC